MNTSTVKTSDKTISDKTMRIAIDSLGKQFVLHTQGSTVISVFKKFSMQAYAGECTVLVGPSGLGKSTLLKCLYGNYDITQGDLRLHFDDGVINLARCEPQIVHSLRRETIAYVSQFLRVIPRVPAIDIVMEPLIAQGVDKNQAEKKAQHLLSRLHIPEHLWALSPTTFSGGEQQRINIARGFIADFPILLLDEPTASLDAKNAAVVVELIDEAKARGAAIVGIFHDEHIREQVADQTIDLTESFL